MEGFAGALFGSLSFKALLQEPRLLVSAEQSKKLQAVWSKVSAALSSVGEPQLRGSMSTGLTLPGKADVDVVVQVPNYSTAKHPEYLKEIAAQLGRSFKDVQEGTLSVQCTSDDGVRIDVLVGNEQMCDPFSFLPATLSEVDRQRLSASVSIYQARFLQAQPSSAKQFMRIVKFWAKVLHEKDFVQPGSAPKSYLLVLLALHCFQAAASGGSQTQEEHLALAMYRFLQLVARLSPSTLISFDVYYNNETVLKAVADSAIQRCLRPPGYESHPLILDPANVTSNVAISVRDLEVLKSCAQRDLDSLQSTSLGAMHTRLEATTASLEEARSHLLLLASLTSFNNVPFVHTFEGKKLLEGQAASVLVDTLIFGALKVQLKTVPLSIKSVAGGKWEPSLGIQLVLPEQLDEKSTQLLAMLPEAHVQLVGFSFTRCRKDYNGTLVLDGQRNPLNYGRVKLPATPGGAVVLATLSGEPCWTMMGYGSNYGSIYSQCNGAETTMRSKSKQALETCWMEIKGELKVVGR